MNHQQPRIPVEVPLIGRQPARKPADVAWEYIPAPNVSPATAGVQSKDGHKVVIVGGLTKVEKVAADLVVAGVPVTEAVRRAMKLFQELEGCDEPS